MARPARAPSRAGFRPTTARWWGIFSQVPSGCETHRRISASALHSFHKHLSELVHAAEGLANRPPSGIDYLGQAPLPAPEARPEAMRGTDRMAGSGTTTGRLRSCVWHRRQYMPATMEGVIDSSRPAPLILRLGRQRATVVS